MTSCPGCAPVSTPSTEDTFILLDALEQDLEALRAQHSSLCLEIGYASRSLRLKATSHELLLKDAEAWPTDLGQAACRPSCLALYSLGQVSTHG